MNESRCAGPPPSSFLVYVLQLRKTNKITNKKNEAEKTSVENERR